MGRAGEHRVVAAEERCLYVGQREVGVAGPEDSLELLGSEDATTCHIVILREVESGVTGVGHLDSEEPGQLLALERAVRDRAGVRSVTRQLDTMEYTVSLLGGYKDENGTSEEITDCLLSVMQVPQMHWVRDASQTSDLDLWTLTLSHSGSCGPVPA